MKRLIIVSSLIGMVSVGGATTLALIPSTQATTASTNINSIFTNTQMSSCSTDNQWKDQDIIQFLYQQVKDGPNAHVINDIEIGTKTTNVNIVTVQINVKQGSTEYTGSVNITYTLTNKTSLSSLFVNTAITTPLERDWWQSYDDTGSDTENKLFIFNQFKTLNNITNFNVNQITIRLEYATDVNIKNRIGTAKFEANDWSSMYTGSVDFTFAFKIRLDKIFQPLSSGVVLAYSPYDSADAQKKEHLTQDALNRNKVRIADFTTFVNFINVTSFNDSTRKVTFAKKNGSS